MGFFSIDIEKYYNEQAAENKSLLGLFTLQYPIYCIHANILDSTPNALDNLDKVIADFITTKPDISSLQMSALLGTSNGLVKQRIGLLLSDELIEHSGNGLSLTFEGNKVFNEKKENRQHKRSFDFYIDGITLQPLPAVYYRHYKSKFISEYDSYMKTRKNGKEFLEQPFGPDLVHTPPVKEDIVRNIFSIPSLDRDKFEIPIGLQEIEDLTYTKMGMHVMVAVLKQGDQLQKVLIDPNAIYTISSGLSYTEALTQHVKIFVPTLESKIKNLEFTLFTRPKKDHEEKEPIPILKTNWSEIDKYTDSENKCFRFAKDDIIKAMKGMYGMKTLDDAAITNTETTLEINISKKILLDSENRGKLINDLIRKRDYQFGNVDNNVFLMFVHYTTTDPYVLDLIKFKELVQAARSNEGINPEWVDNKSKEFSVSFRELCISTGELDLLEKIDILKHMCQCN
jgi:hypothetical protein